MALRAFAGGGNGGAAGGLIESRRAFIGDTLAAEGVGVGCAVALLVTTSDAAGTGSAFLGLSGLLFFFFFMPCANIAAIRCWLALTLDMNFFTPVPLSWLSLR